MKNLILFSLFVVCIIFGISCGFDEELIPLNGEWLLHSSSGGIGGGVREEDGDNVMIIKENELTWRMDGITKFQGKVCHDEGEFFESIVLYNVSEQSLNEFGYSLLDGMRYQIIQDSLTLIDNCDDCHSYHFVRK